VLIGVSGAVVGGSTVMPADLSNSFYQPRWFSVLVAALATCAAYVLWRCYRIPRFAPIAALLTIAVFVGVAYAGVMININAARWNDPTATVRRFRERLPHGAQLVSFTPIDHRFAYYYQRRVAELDWPLKLSDLPPDVEYFCFMRYPGDTAERRAAGRGRTWTTTPGTLPFAWEEIAAICVERRVRNESQPMVVLGRVVRPVRATVSDATAPQPATARTPRSSQRK
jgi:hypothetical protein